MYLFSLFTIFIPITIAVYHRRYDAPVCIDGDVQLRTFFDPPGAYPETPRAELTYVTQRGPPNFLSYTRNSLCLPPGTNSPPGLDCKCTGEGDFIHTSCSQPEGWGMAQYLLAYDECVGHCVCDEADTRQYRDGRNSGKYQDLVAKDAALRKKKGRSHQNPGTKSPLDYTLRDVGKYIAGKCKWRCSKMEHCAGAFPVHGCDRGVCNVKELGPGLYSSDGLCAPKSLNIWITTLGLASGGFLGKRDFESIGMGPCACNATYVSRSCCDSREGLVWESPDAKLGILQSLSGVGLG